MYPIGPASTQLIDTSLHLSTSLSFVHDNIPDKIASTVDPSTTVTRLESSSRIYLEARWYMFPHRVTRRSVGDIGI
jgi:hypothetical protein